MEIICSLSGNIYTTQFDKSAFHQKLLETLNKEEDVRQNLLCTSELRNLVQEIY